MRYRSFNAYLKEAFGQRVQKITLDAGLSCPNRDGTRGTGGCIYCDSRGSGTGAADRYPNIREQALAARDFLGSRYKAKKFIAYFQSFCNTYASHATLKAMYDEAAAIPGVVGLAVATRPDCLSRDVLELLSGYTSRLMVWLELGLQSIHDSTLSLVNRGHTYQEFLDGYGLARHYPLCICLHVILGLPGERREEMHATAREVARLRPEGIKIHSLYITRGTALEQLFHDGRYRPLEQGEFVGRACDFLELLPPETVIQRLTGDPGRDELVAPAWSLRKHETLKMIEQELQQRHSRQGKKYNSVLCAE